MLDEVQKLSPLSPAVMEHLQKHYRLSNKELRTACAAIEGLNAKEIANRCGLSTNTAKAQLKAVMKKINVNRANRLIIFAWQLEKYFSERAAKEAAEQNRLLFEAG